MACKLPPERREGQLPPLFHLHQEGKSKCGRDQRGAPCGAGASPEICSKEPGSVSDAVGPLLLYLLVFQDKPENNFLKKNIQRIMLEVFKLQYNFYVKSPKFYMSAISKISGKNCF